jgi:hypothetical protein
LKKLNSLFSVHIMGLDADTNYKIKIYAEQVSTHLLSKSVDISFTTKRSSIKKFFIIYKKKIFFFSIERNS